MTCINPNLVTLLILRWKKVSSLHSQIQSGNKISLIQILKQCLILVSSLTLSLLLILLSFHHVQCQCMSSYVSHLFIQKSSLFSFYLSLYLCHLCQTNLSHHIKLIVVMMVMMMMMMMMTMTMTMMMIVIITIIIMIMMMMMIVTILGCDQSSLNLSKHTKK